MGSLHIQIQNIITLIGASGKNNQTRTNQAKPKAHQHINSRPETKARSESHLCNKVLPAPAKQAKQITVIYDNDKH